MTPGELEEYLKVFGDVRSVVVHVLRQQKLDDDDHAFLQRHIQQLDVVQLSLWLIFSPPCSVAIVKRLFDLLHDEGQVGGRLVFYAGPHLEEWPSAALDELCDLLQAESDVPWHVLLPRLRGLSPCFHALVATESKGQGFPLSLALWSDRRHQRQIEERLLRWARTGEPLDSGAPQLPSRQYLLRVLEEHGLLAKVDDPRTMLPARTVFGLPSAHARWPEDEGDAFLHELALRWPGPGSAAARQWYIDQALEAIGGGERWGRLWWHLASDELRRDVALASLNTSSPAPWLGRQLFERAEQGDTGVWALAFAWLERIAPDPELVHLQDCLRSNPEARHFRRRTASDASPREHLESWFDVGQEALALLWNAPLPRDADERFEERWLACIERWSGRAVHGFFRHPGDHLTRLADLPLDQGRARRLLRRMAAEEHFSEELFLKLAPLAGECPELLPAWRERWHGLPPDEVEAFVAAYRKMGGKDADAEISRWMHHAFSTGQRSLSRGGEYHLAAACPDLLDAELKEKIRNALRQEEFSSFLHFGNRVPWAKEGADLRELALESLRRDPRSWYTSNSLPDAAKDAVIEHLRGALLDQRGMTTDTAWLLARGSSNAELLDLFLEQDCPERVELELAMWLSERLASRSEWDRSGKRLMLKFLRAGRFELIGGLGLHMLVHSQAKPEEAGSETQSRPGDSLWLVRFHEALARALTEQLDEYLVAGADEQATAVSRALFCLQPRSHAWNRVNALYRKHKPAGLLGDVLGATVEHLRRVKSKEASFGDVRLALGELARPAPVST